MQWKVRTIYEDIGDNMIHCTSIFGDWECAQKFIKEESEKPEVVRFSITPLRFDLEELYATDDSDYY